MTRKPPKRPWLTLFLILIVFAIISFGFIEFVKYTVSTTYPTPTMPPTLPPTVEPTSVPIQNSGGPDS